MVMVLICWLAIGLMLAGSLVWIHAGTFITANWIPLTLALAAIVAAVYWHLYAAVKQVEELAATTSEQAEWAPGEGWTKTRESDDGTTVVWELSDAAEPTPATTASELSQVEFLRRRLDEELRAKWQAQQLVLEGPADARLSGRVVRFDRKDEAATFGGLWLAVIDEDGSYQAVKLSGAFSDLVRVSEGDRVTLLATWRRGRLTWVELESRAACDEPLPEVNLPEPKGSDAAKQGGKLSTMDELDKAARDSGWGSLNHSKYRCPIAWHLTTSPKFRAKLFAGRAAEVQAIVREVAEAEGLRVIAAAAEVDHLHLLGVPKGKGGMPPTWVWSSWIGRFKARTSQRLKGLPGLEDFQWQVGYALTAVSGGRQGAEEALEVVKRYVESQGDNHHPEGNEPSDAT